MKRILVVNQKGGVGKTTLAFLIAMVLGKLDIKVAVEDLDPQKDLTHLIKLFDLPLSLPDKADVIITDTSPRIHPSEILSLAPKATKILIPFTPHPLGFQRVLSLLDLLSHFQEKIVLALNLFRRNVASHQAFLQHLTEKKLPQKYPFFTFSLKSSLAELDLKKLTRDDLQNLKVLLKCLLKT